LDVGRTFTIQHSLTDGESQRLDITVVQIVGTGGDGHDRVLVGWEALGFLKNEYILFIYVRWVFVNT
jgi:hypothetical protein